MRQRDVQAGETELANELNPFAQISGFDVQPGVLHVDTALVQCGIMYFRGKRMSHRIANDCQADRRINLVRGLAPIPQIVDGIDLFSCLFLHPCKQSTLTRITPGGTVCLWNWSNKIVSWCEIGSGEQSPLDRTVTASPTACWQHAICMSH